MIASNQLPHYINPACSLDRGSQVESFKISATRQPGEVRRGGPKHGGRWARRSSIGEGAPIDRYGCQSSG